MKAEYTVKTIIQDVRMRVETLEDLANLRDEKRSVICPNGGCYSDPKPAAFVINYSACVVLSLIKTGLYVHDPKLKTKPKRRKAQKKPVEKRTTPAAKVIPPPKYDPRSVCFNALERVKAELDVIEKMAKGTINLRQPGFFKGIDYGKLITIKQIRKAIDSNSDEVKS